MAVDSGMRSVWTLSRPYLSDRKVLAVLAAAMIGAGLWLSWGWLATAGIAPVLVALAPCAAMCALGLCMKGSGGKSCASNNGTGGAQAGPRRTGSD